MMAALVTLEQARWRLRLTADDTFHTPDVQMKMVQATALVVDYIKRPEHGWSPETVPPVIQAAILEVLRHLFEGAEDPLPRGVQNTLDRFRDPAIA
jgi:hypothetical protein